MDALAAVEDEVREIVRRRGLDPMADAPAMRTLVSQVIADFEERSLGGGHPPLADPDEAARTILDAVAGFGPLATLP